MVRAGMVARLFAPPPGQGRSERSFGRKPLVPEPLALKIPRNLTVAQNRSQARELRDGLLRL
jgi:hypothetical protein